jgi:hypothetical protein
MKTPYGFTRNITKTHVMAEERKNICAYYANALAKNTQYMCGHIVDSR